MKLLAANRGQKWSDEVWRGGPPPQDFTPAEKLALDQNQGRRLMEGAEGGKSSNHGANGSSQPRTCVHGMFQWVNVKILLIAIANKTLTLI